MSGVMVKLPEYQCTKKVYALKIKEMTNENDQDYIVAEDPKFAPIPVDKEYMKKHEPQAGGYYVIYKDGYKSWSPAKTFEEGYELID